MRFEECHLPPGTPNLVAALKEAGYETAVFGFNHVWQDFFDSDPAVVGREIRVDGEMTTVMSKDSLLSAASSARASRASIGFSRPAANISP